MTEIRFRVLGTPRAQGSKRHVGHGIMVEMSKDLPVWRQDVARAAQEAAGGITVQGPLAVYATFYFSRPKAHYGSGKNAHLLKRGAPLWKTTYPDADKLLRALFDALTASGVIRDDAQIAPAIVRKQYGSPGVWVTISEAE